MSRWFRPICAQRGSRLCGGLLLSSSLVLWLVVASPVIAQERPVPRLKGGISIDAPADNAGDQFDVNTNLNADCEQRYAKAAEAVREEQTQNELQLKNDRIDCRGNASCQQQASAKYVARSGEIRKKLNTIAAQRGICQDRRRLAQYLAEDKANDPCEHTYAQAAEAVREEQTQNELQLENDRIDCRGNASCQQQASAKYVARSGEIRKKLNTIAAQRDICQDRRRLAKNKPGEGPPGTLPGEHGTPSQPPGTPQEGGSAKSGQPGTPPSWPPQKGGVGQTEQPTPADQGKQTDPGQSREQPQKPRSGQPLQGGVTTSGPPQGQTGSGIGVGASATDPTKQAPQAPVDEPTVVFNYYYINGINTPLSYPPGRRGSYRWERRMIAGNLLDLPPGAPARVPAASQHGPSYGETVRVRDNERNVFETETYNSSGTDPNGRIARLCEQARTRSVPNATSLTYQLLQAVCTPSQLDAIRKWRATGVGGMAPGDLFESFWQSQNYGDASSDMKFSANLPEVKNVAAIIVDLYRRTRASRTERHYFVLIAHSQGNFFAEAVAYRLMKLEGTDGRFVFDHRLGILSFGSPTSYTNLPDDFRVNRLKHLTRADDGIHTLDSVAGELGHYGSPPKTPFPRQDDLPSLWPWPRPALDNSLLFWIPWRLPFWDTMMLGPPMDSSRDWLIASCELRASDIDEQARCDGALYTPLINSHLLDNYISDPTLTMPGQPISLGAAALLGLPSFQDRSLGARGRAVSWSPETKPVLAQARRSLAQLKRLLLYDGQ